jgi:hypothetical protein
MQHRKLEEQVGELISISLMAKVYTSIYVHQYMNVQLTKSQKLSTFNPNSPSLKTRAACYMFLQQEEICLLKEENEKRRKEMLDMPVKKTSVAGFSGEKHTIEQKEKGKHVVASEKVGIMEEPARKSSFRVCRPEGTFLWPNMASTGSYSSHSMSSATAQAHQLFVIPSPTSPLPPLLPAFFCQQQPDGCKQVQSFPQAQSHSVLAQSLGHGMARQLTARYPSEVGILNKELT